MVKYVAYFRVSTARQGKSGLGLASQQEKVRSFLAADDELVGEFVEVESGRNDQRAELWKAITLAKRSNAKLLIAKLDRFSRRVSFIAHVMEQGIALVVAEMPNATDFQLHIFAALAQEERRMISERTRSALAEAKRRGVVLGKHGRILAEHNRRAADQRAAALEAIVAPMIAEGLSYRAIAGRLNGLRISTVHGGIYHTQSAKNLVDRLRRFAAEVS